MNSLKYIKNYFSIKYVFIITIIVLLMYTYIYTIGKFSEHSRKIGYEKVSVFLTKVEYTIKSFDALVEREIHWFDNNMGDNIFNQRTLRWISDFNILATNTLKVTRSVSHIIIGDNIFSSSLEFDSIIKDSINSSWYKKLLEDTNKTIRFSPLFCDDKGQYFSTMYKFINVNGKDVVVAVTLPLYDLEKVWFDSEIHDFEQIYYLADQSSGVVFSTYDLKATSMFKDNLNLLIDEIENSKNIHGVLSKEYSNGITYSIFYINKLDNNFIPIVVMPKEYMLSTIMHNIEFYIYVILFFVLVVIIMYINDIKNNIKSKRYNEFISILGNANYAIFSINIKTDKYEIVKGSGDAIKYVPKFGDYTYLHKMLCTIVEKGTQGDFADSFSLENIRKLAENDRVDFGGDFQRILENGYKWVQIRFLYDSKVNPDYAVLAFRDRDKERKRELEKMELLESSISAMKKANKSKVTFYSGLSHDMRTPLNAIIGLTELLEEDIDDKSKALGYMEKIKVSSQQLLSLIDNFLDYAKKDYQDDDGEDNVCFKLQEFIDSNLSIYKIVSEKDKKNFSVTYNITHNKIKGNATKLYRIINNIMSNCFKYTKQGDTIELKVTEIGNQGRPKYKFEFIDTGIGMDKEFLQTMCSPYKREKRFETKESAGVGLGMAIVENYVHYLNGEIFIESQLNKGTKITITLAFDLSSEEIEENKVEQQEKEDNIKGLNILIAEDNDVNMYIVTELLTRNGHKIIKAYNGQEAVDIFSQGEENSFDIILMDIQMPILNGIEATKKIRMLEREDAKNIPIVAVSANVYTEDVAASNNAGMNAHLSKPVNFNELQKVFNSLIKKNK